MIRPTLLATLLTLAACGIGHSPIPPARDAGHDAGPGGMDAGIYTGSDTCNDVYQAGWDQTLTASDFKSQVAWEAYESLQKCACVDTSTSSTPSGCSDICTQPQNGTTTNNFCNGVAALTQCANCLMSNCNAQTVVCQGN